MRRSGTLLLAFAACAASWPAAAMEDFNSAATPLDVAAERRQLAAEEARLRRRGEHLERQRRDLERLARRQAPPARLFRTQATTGGVPEPGRPAGDGAPRPPEVPALAEHSGVLLPKGHLLIEPSVEYVRTDVNNAEVVGFTVLPGIVFGDIIVSEANRDSVVASTAARFGLTDRFEIEGKILYVYRDDSTRTRPLGSAASTDVITKANGHGLGDVEFAVHYQMNDGRNGWPFFIGNVRVKTPTGTDPFEVEHDPLTNAEVELPTGTGFWGVQPSLTVIYPSDPAVLFGGLSYTWNVERDVGDSYGRIDPGDTIGFNFGIGVALNERLSFSLAYDHSIVLPSWRDGGKLPGSEVLQVGSLVFGTALKFGEHTSAIVSISAGVTRDAPDLRLLLKVPVATDLFK